MDVTTHPVQIDPAQFRQVLGQYPTGVVVVTASGPEGEPIGMTVGSFTSVSVDPPLVAFLPDQRSGSWRSLRESGSDFCVNVLSSRQEDVCRQIATRKVDKFDGLEWETSPGGSPVLSGAVAYIDCTTDAIHDAGDHHIVIGRVRHLRAQSSDYPLLFFRGGYGSFRPVSLGAADADLLSQMRRVDLVRPTLERLAEEVSAEVSALCVVGDELVIAASAGQERSAEVPTRVGQRWPFAPPMGSVFAAWGDEDVRARWLGRTPPGSEMRDLAEWLLKQSLADGHVLAISTAAVADHADGVELFRGGRATITSAMAERILRTDQLVHNPRPTDLPDEVIVRSLSVPVVAGPEDVACCFTLWGPRAPLARETVLHAIERIVSAADAAGSVLREHAAGWAS
ncbi:flavin reductase [Aeromicrobium alkaliterrae]|uniref:Flavin reductase n=1 Tax=Aeromicrobium alkaliterrae TaxID=302168 RepID=A0ABN2JP52_9ACTN